MRPRAPKLPVDVDNGSSRSAQTSEKSPVEFSWIQKTLSLSVHTGMSGMTYARLSMESGQFRGSCIVEVYFGVESKMV